VDADDRSGPDTRLATHADPASAAGFGAGQYNVTVSGGRGVYVGDHGIQVNLFTGERPRGPVVAGNVPQAPRAFRPREALMAGLRPAGPGVYATGRLAETIAQYEQAVTGFDRQLGPAHPLTIDAQANLNRARHQAMTAADTPPPN
jgi:hypothetical protein